MPLLPKLREKELIRYKTRQGRKKANFVIVEGRKCCTEVLKSQKKAIRFALTSGDADPVFERYDFPVYNCGAEQFEALSFTENPQGMLLVVDKATPGKFIFADPFLLVLDGLQEPGNIGTILRTAAAVGLTEVALTKGTVDPFNPKSIRAGMGAQFNLNISMFDSLADLLLHKKVKGRTIWLSTPHQGLSCYDAQFVLKNSVMVMGREASGIKCFASGTRVMIPMPGKAESLNVAQAATIFIFEGVRQGLFTS